MQGCRDIPPDPAGALRSDPRQSFGFTGDVLASKHTMLKA